jgi:hypothetical protein
MVSGGMSGEQAFFFFFLLFPAHLVSPCCYANAAHSQHGMFKDLPSFVTICTPQDLAAKVTCMQDCRRRISPACTGQELPFQLSTVYSCTTWLLDPKALALLPGFCIVVSLLPVLKHGWCKASPDCCHGCPNLMPDFVSKNGTYTCLYTYVHTQCQVSQVAHIWSCLVCS